MDVLVMKSLFKITVDDNFNFILIIIIMMMMI